MDQVVNETEYIIASPLHYFLLGVIFFFIVLFVLFVARSSKRARAVLMNGIQWPTAYYSIMLLAFFILATVISISVRESFSFGTPLNNEVANYFLLLFCLIGFRWLCDFIINKMLEKRKEKTQEKCNELDHQEFSTSERDWCIIAVMITIFLMLLFVSKRPEFSWLWLSIIIGKWFWVRLPSRKEIKQGLTMQVVVILVLFIIATFVAVFNPLVFTHAICAVVSSLAGVLLAAFLFHCLTAGGEDPVTGKWDI